MKVSIFGIGYVGCVGIGCLAELGHKVIGIDKESLKVDLINNGKATIVEEKIENLIEKHKKIKNISASLVADEGVQNSDVAILCVGTPNDRNGHLNMSYIFKVAEEIAKSISKKEKFFTIAIRSTVSPGTNEKLCEIIEKTSGKKRDIDFGVVSNPEFLREGSAVKDFFSPPYTILASTSSKALGVMKRLYSKIEAPIYITDVGSAELIKFVNNSFHALKVSFANEVGRISKELGVDSRNLMDLFVNDTSLNISPYYFKPGFAYGGSCLPKDLKALNTLSHDNYVKNPILQSISKSNRSHIESAIKMVLNRNKRNIGIYGISFKPGTDDMRFSPALEVAERLLGKGLNIKVYDRNVNISKIVGKNKEFLFNKLPHINNILSPSLKEFIEGLDLLIIANNDNRIKKLLNMDISELEVLDLVGNDFLKDKVRYYEGICW